MSLRRVKDKHLRVDMGQLRHKPGTGRIVSQPGVGERLQNS